MLFPFRVMKISMGEQCGFCFVVLKFPYGSDGISSREKILLRTSAIFRDIFSDVYSIFMQLFFVSFFIRFRLPFSLFFLPCPVVFPALSKSFCFLLRVFFLPAAAVRVFRCWIFSTLLQSLLPWLVFFRARFKRLSHLVR